MGLNEYTDIFLAVLTGFFALIVVVGRSPVVCALALLMSFITLGGIYFQLGSLFLTVIQILVYAGAIAILFIFVLMLLNTSEHKDVQRKKSLNPIIGTISCFIFFGACVLVLHNNMDYLNTDRLPFTPMKLLFDDLFNKYLLPFELATVLLLAGIVAAVAVAQQRSKNND